MRSRRFADLDGFRHWDTDRQNRAGAVMTASGLDMTALRLDKPAADRQPQAGTGTTPVLRLDAIEFVEDPLEIGGRDAWSLIGDFDRHCLAIVLRPNIDAAAGRGIFGSVVEQVEKHLLKEDRVEPHHRQIGRDLDLDAVAYE